MIFKDLSKIIIDILILILISSFYLISCDKIINPGKDDNDHTYPVPGIRSFSTTDEEPDWSPTGDIIAYVHLPRDSTYLIEDGIWLLELHNMERRFLTHGREPEWSPDGSKIAYVNGDNIFVIDVETEEIWQLTDFGGSYYPCWSPNGKTIYFDTNHNDPNGASVIWKMNSDGNNKQCISKHGVGEWRDPQCSPDGEKILHSRYLPNDDSSEPELFLMDTTGNNPIQLTSNDADERDADWSPQGDKIVYGSCFHKNEVEKSGIYIMELDNGKIYKINNGGGYPSWSPDGSKIVYYDNYDEYHGTLWLMNSDGSNKEPLTTPNTP
jgi:TolB protein